MNAKVFLDTNIWIYLYSEDTKSPVAEQIIHRYFENIVVSTQVLGECFTVLTRKKFKTGEESKEIIRDIASAYTVADIGKSSVLKAVDIYLRYRYSYYDSLIIASALENNCAVLYTEDMCYNQLVENRMKIINPFV